MFNVLTAYEFAAVNDGAVLAKITRESLVMACWCRRWRAIELSGAGMALAGGRGKSSQSNEPTRRRRVVGSRLSISEF
jgi:hypothetical protein